MTSGITDSRWPPRRAAAEPTPVPAQYPSYLASRPPVEPRRPSPLVSAVGAYVFSFVAQLLAAIPLSLFVVARGVSVISGPHTDEDISHAAFVAAMVFMVTLAVVGLLASWTFLRLRAVRGALLVAFLGLVADWVGTAAGRAVAEPLGWVLGALCGVGVMLLTMRARARKN